jgi:hypothetical protein
LIDLIERCSCFDDPSKLKLILFAAGVKPSTFVPLKITPKNLGDKSHFERHLRENDFLFKVDDPNSFEEISTIKNNKIIWAMHFIWLSCLLY